MVSNQLEKENVSLPLIMKAPKRAVVTTILITQNLVNYSTRFYKLQYICKASKKQTSTTSKHI